MKIIGSILLLVCVAAISLGVEVTTYAQLGKLKCRIVNGNGKKVQRVVVIIEGEGVSRKLVSNKAGEFEIKLPAGTYRVILEKPGLAKLTVTDVIVEPDTQRIHKFQMYDSRNVQPWIHIQRAPEQEVIRPERE